jgi:HEPN domain-containing protein
MPYDPVRLADTRAWIEKARLDLGAGEADLSHDPPFCGDAMFHAQQAVEKALKGLLSWHESPFRKTHDLRELFAACCAADPSLRSLGDRAEGLTPYAWVFRYPGESEEPARGDAEQALDLAREVFEAILARLPEEDRQ